MSGMKTAGEKTAGNNNSMMRRVLLACVEVLFCWLTIRYGGNGFRRSTQAFLYVLSVLPSFWFSELQKFFSGVLRSRKKRILFLLMALISGFCYTGNRAFLYPLNKRVSLSDLGIFLVSVVWVIPIFALFCCVLEGRSSCASAQVKPIRRRRRLRTPIFLILSGIMLLLPACYALYAFNPGISSPDSAFCMDAAHHLYGMANWHPPFYCMLLKAILLLWDSTYLVILFQFAFWVFVLEDAFLFCRQRGISDGVLLLISLLMGINPANYIQLCTIWKDIPYGISLVWLTVALAKLVLRQENSILVYLEFVSASVFTFFLRQNGIVPCLLCLLAVVIIFRKDRKLRYSVGISILAIVLIRGPVYSALHIQKAGGGIYIGLSQDILGVYYAGGDVSDETMEMIRTLIDDNPENYSYSPYWSKASYDLDVSMGEFIGNYVDTFRRHPVLMLRAILCRQDGYWDLFWGQDSILAVQEVNTSEGSINYTGTMDDSDTTWSTYYPRRVVNNATERLSRLDDFIVFHELPKWLTWHTGQFFLAALWAFLDCLFQRRRNLWLVFLPFAGQVLSLILSTGWSEFRYYWPLNLMTVFLVLLMATISRQPIVEHADKCNLV